MSKKRRLEVLQQSHAELTDAYHRLLMDRDRHLNALKKCARPADYGMTLAEASIAADILLRDGRSTATAD